MLVVGLTGSLAMGKSETAAMFRRLGVPVFDADAVVHALYARGGKAVPEFRRRFPSSVVGEAVDRQRLSDLVMQTPDTLPAIEAMVHPLVRTAEREFMAESRSRGAPLVVLDIPLLFETGREREMDAIVVVSAPPEIQRARALKRPGMTEEKLSVILGRQLSDSEKRRRADFVIDTSQGLEAAFEAVRAATDRLLERYRSRMVE